MKLHPYGEGALYVDLEIEDAPDRGDRTLALAASLRRRLPKSDVVVGAGSLAIVGLGAWDDVERLVVEALNRSESREVAAKVHTLRAVYDGPDLEEVARLTGLSPEEVVNLHASREYTAELVGFLPGFAYLAGVDPRLVVARRPAPRPRVAAGSLGIAGPYTGVYPLASPGGWQLIGRVIGADLFFDAARESPALIEPGDRVRFVPEIGKELA
jgi:KipI family sensor histidine kinase inhibitor